MNPFVLVTGYIAWHYTLAFADIIRVWENIMWFITHFFSLGALARTLFSPWHRMREVYRPGLNIGENLGSLFINLLLRFVGAGVRLLVIAIGLLMLAVFLLGGIFFLALWLVLPLAIPALITIGITLL